MYKLIEGQHIYAGTNEFYRWGQKAAAKVQKALEPNENGFYSIKVDGGKYWTFGTSVGKYGEFAKYKDTFFSVNKGGYLYAKSGTEKGKAFVEMINDMLTQMGHSYMVKKEETEE